MKRYWVMAFLLISASSAVAAPQIECVRASSRVTVWYPKADFPEFYDWLSENVTTGRHRKGAEAVHVGSDLELAVDRSSEKLMASFLLEHDTVDGGFFALYVNLPQVIEGEGGHSASSFAWKLQRLLEKRPLKSADGALSLDMAKEELLRIRWSGSDSCSLR